MKILLSVKPEFAERIFDGSKKYEFRKVMFKNLDVKTVVVYASSPVQRVIGEFEIEEILKDSPDSLWQNTHKYAGISKKFFFEYFAGKTIGFAIKIKEAYYYENPHCLHTKYNIKPPQSFCYI